MPIVKIYTGLKFTGNTKLLKMCCEEIVPAAINSKQGPLHPGDVTIMVFEATDGLNVDVYIEIEAYEYEDREKNKDRRSKAIGLAIKKVHSTFPSPYNDPFSLKVWLKFVTAGYYSNKGKEQKADVNMSMNSAINRIIKNIEFR